jgi:hypothetical protein
MSPPGGRLYIIILTIPVIYQEQRYKLKKLSSSNLLRFQPDTELLVVIGD